MKGRRSHEQVLFFSFCLFDIFSWTDSRQIVACATCRRSYQRCEIMHGACVLHVHKIRRHRHPRVRCPAPEHSSRAMPEPSDPHLTYVDRSRVTPASRPRAAGLTVTHARPAAHAIHLYQARLSSLASAPEIDDQSPHARAPLPSPHRTPTARVGFRSLPGARRRRRGPGALAGPERISTRT